MAISRPRFLLKGLSFLPHRTWQCLTLPCNPISWAMWHNAGRPDRTFDIVHAAAFPYAFPMACAGEWPEAMRVPFVVTPFLHLGDPDDPADATRPAYTTTRAHVAAAQARTASSCRRPVNGTNCCGRGLAEEKLILQGLGVDAVECTGGDRQAARRGWQTQPGEVVIGHLANNSYEKGTVDLLRAVKKLSERRYQCP